MRKLVLALAGAAALAFSAAGSFAEEAKEAPLPKVNWSFYGIFGTYDRAELQRGFQVYTEVCANCHALSLVAYRDLGNLGFSEAEVKAIAASHEVVNAEPNDEGEMFKRPGRPADRFVKPFANDQAARVANGGALPPDLSLMAKAREGGPDYIFGLLTGYKQAPAGTTIPQGMYYNEYFPGHQIAMPPPLNQGQVSFSDNTESSVENEAKAITAFLQWAAEPNLEARHRTGFKVMLFLLVLTLALFGVKRKIWKDVH